MKKYLFAFSFFLAALFSAPVANAAGLLGPSSGGVLTPGLWIPNSASSTITPNPTSLQVPCANIVGGCISATATTTINGVTGPTFTFSVVSTSSASSITTSSAQVFLNLLTNTSSSDITITSTGTILFASHNISQFTNNSGYITTSTNNFGGLTNASITANSPVVWSSTSTISCPTCITSAVTSLTGTAGQVNVSNATGSVTLSLPQNVNTTSSPTFSGVTINGTSTSLTFYSSSTSNTLIQEINSVQNIPANYATAGCFGSAGTTDLGGCINLAYNNVSSTASGTVITVPVLSGVINFSTGIVFANLNEYASLQCTPGTILNFTGSGVALTLNEGTGSSYYHVPHFDSGCQFQNGASNATSTATSTGILIGGTNGESGLTLSNMSFNNFGLGARTATNTYMLIMQGVQFHGNYQTMVVNTASNSGESMKFIGDTFADNGAAVTSTNCVQFKGVSVASAFFDGGSFDGCQLDIGIGNTVTENMVHHENTNSTGYGAYSFTVVESDTVTNFTSEGSSYQNDATSTNTPAQAIACDANCTIVGDIFAKNGTGVFTTAVGPDANGLSTDVINETGIVCQNGACTNTLGGNSGVLPPAGTFYNYHNSYDAGCGENNTNVFNCWNGGGITFSNAVAAGGNNGDTLTGFGGNYTASTTLQVYQTAVVNSSTLQIGSLGKNACLKLSDEANTANLVYAYVSSTAWVLTQTKPTFCM